MTHRQLLQFPFFFQKLNVSYNATCSSNPTIIRPSTKPFLPSSALNLAFGSHHGKSSNHNTNKFLFHNPTSPMLLTPLRQPYLRPRRNPHNLYSQCRQSLIHLNSVNSKRTVLVFTVTSANSSYHLTPAAQLLCEVQSMPSMSNQKRLELISQKLDKKFLCNWLTTQICLETLHVVWQSLTFYCPHCLVEIIWQLNMRHPSMQLAVYYSKDTPNADDSQAVVTYLLTGQPTHPSYLA